MGIPKEGGTPGTGQRSKLRSKAREAGTALRTRGRGGAEAEEDRGDSEGLTVICHHRVSLVMLLSRPQMMLYALKLCPTPQTPPIHNGLCKTVTTGLPATWAPPFCLPHSSEKGLALTFAYLSIYPFIHLVFYSFSICPSCGKLI